MVQKSHNLKELLENLKAEDRILVDYYENCEPRMQEGRLCLIANSFLVLLDNAVHQETSSPFHNNLKDLIPIEYQFIKRISWSWAQNRYLCSEDF